MKSAKAREPQCVSPSRAGCERWRLLVPAADGLDPRLTVRAIAEGAVIADYDSDTYRSDRKDRSVQSLQVVAPPSADRPAAEAGLARRRDRRRIPELCPRAGQRARQSPHADHPRASGPRKCAASSGSNARVYQHRQAPRAGDGRFPQRHAGLRRAARAHRDASTSQKTHRLAPSSDWSARALPSTPAAFPSSPPTAWRR